MNLGKKENMRYQNQTVLGEITYEQNLEPSFHTAYETPLKKTVGNGSFLISDQKKVRLTRYDQRISSSNDNCACNN